ncbi:ABC transporter ATP-binding protein [uncultured Alistipes sp.]|uniref:ABC transporter ATP-binding protein n=1 Tax=uncultured Alistipes sp. TaxID=538949 RepID=UPI0026019A2C|nr:ABC transporter ATP-binding protein [uncultured Alistipes sp.]
MTTFAMMFRTFRDILPARFRRRSIGVALSVFLRALLNFAGLAVLVPVLVIILDTEGIHSNLWLERIYLWGGFSDDRRFILAVCTGVVGVVLLKNLANLLLYKVERNFIYDLYRDLSRRLYIDYHDRGLAFVKSSNSAILSRNVNAVCLIFVTGVLMPLAAIASETMLFLLLFTALALYSPLASAIALLVFVPAVMLYYGLVRRQLNRYGEEEHRAQRTKSRTVAETFRGYADLEVANAFPEMLKTFDGAMDRVVQVRERNATIAVLPSIFTEVGLAAGMALLVALCAGTDNTQMKLLFGIFAVAALRIMPSIRSIMGAWTSLRYNRYTLDVLRDARTNGTAPESAPSNERLAFQREITIEGLSFHYDDAPDHDVLHDFSLTIRKGERIGIRGVSGAGKTTLFNILLGLYKPSAGRIAIDGVPLTAENRRQWQNAVGYVSQNVFVTDSSFAANVALGCAPERIDRQRAAQALAMAKLGDFIETLPKGMDTPIGECGCRLSGGQRQRLGIARALYKQADILFFDEATSSLDNRTEEGINRAIEELSRDNRELTIVVIAHRESSLEFCDRIITIG